ncbi:MAG: hypothetical protein R3F13_04080 [Prosthecobacter sp.]
MLSDITLNDSSLKLLLGIVGVLLAVAFVRLFLLFRANRRLRIEIARMEKQSASLHHDLSAIKHDARSWREKMQRQFDALRADFAAKGEQASRSQSSLLKSLEEKMQEAPAAVPVVDAPVAAISPAFPPKVVVPPPAEAKVPTLPAIETLRTEVLTSEIASLKDQLQSARQQCASLQRSLALSRRRVGPSARVRNARQPR